MRILVTKKLSAALRSCASAASTTTTSNGFTTFTSSKRLIKLHPSDGAYGGSFLHSPWFAKQLRFARFTGGDVRPGNVIERKGKLYQVVKAQHTTQGRQGAIIQVELRDVGTGNKVHERFRTDEGVEKIYVQEKSYTYLYTDDETGNIVLMEPKTYEQLEVPKHLFGESIVYLQDDMKIIVQIYDERPMSVTIPTRVTCTVVEAADAQKGSGPTHYKKAVLDNGLTVLVPAHIASGDQIVISTADNSYASRA